MRKENNHRSEMVSQLLYGDCFKIIGTKKEWLQITTLLDSYTGWIDNKQSHTIEESIAKKVGVETPSYATQLIDYLETQNNELIALVLGSNVKASSLLKHTYEGSQTTGEKEKSNLLKIKGIGTFHLKGFDRHESCFPSINQEEIFIKKEGITPLIYPSTDYPTYNFRLLFKRTFSFISKGEYIMEKRTYNKHRRHA